MYTLGAHSMPRSISIFISHGRKIRLTVRSEIPWVAQKLRPHPIDGFWSSGSPLISWSFLHTVSFPEFVHLRKNRLPTRKDTQYIESSSEGTLGSDYRATVWKVGPTANERCLFVQRMATTSLWRNNTSRPFPPLSDYGSLIGALFQSANFPTALCSNGNIFCICRRLDWLWLISYITCSNQIKLLASLATPYFITKR